jgi:hypothetical protein
MRSWEGPKSVWLLWDIERLCLDCPARAGNRGTILECSSPQANPCTSIATYDQVKRMEVSVSIAVIPSCVGRDFGAGTPILLGETQMSKRFIISEPIFYFQYNLFYEPFTVSDHIASTVGWFGKGMKECCVGLFQTTRPRLPGRAEDFSHDSLCLCRNFKCKTLIVGTVVAGAVSSKIHPPIHPTDVLFIWPINFIL